MKSILEETTAHFDHQKIWRAVARNNAQNLHYHEQLQKYGMRQGPAQGLGLTLSKKAA